MKIRMVSKVFLMLVGSTLSVSVQAVELSEAVKHAIHFNPDVQFQVSRRLVDDQGIRQAEAGFFPTVDLTAGVGIESSRNSTTRSGLTSDSRGLKRSEGSIVATQNLFAGMETLNEVQRNKARVSASAYTIAGTAEDIGLQVVEAYINVLRFQKLIQHAKRNVIAHQHIVDMIRERSEAGVSRAVELTQAQGRLALARANYIAEKGNLEDAKTAYARVVGKMPDYLVMPPIPGKNALPKNEKMALHMALAYHPTLKAALADVEEAKAQKRTSHATNLPRVDLVLAAARDNNLDGQIGVSNDSSAMLRMSYNVFNGGADFARQSQAAYQVQEAMEVKNRTILQVEEASRLAWNAFQVTKARLPFLRMHRESVKATLEAYTEQFKVGKRSLLDVLDTENEYFRSSIDFTNERFTSLFARYRILNSMGHLLRYLHIPLPREAQLVHHVF